MLLIRTHVHCKKVKKCTQIIIAIVTRCLHLSPSHRKYCISARCYPTGRYNYILQLYSAWATSKKKNDVTYLYARIRAFSLSREFSFSQLGRDTRRETLLFYRSHMHVHLRDCALTFNKLSRLKLPES